MKTSLIIVMALILATYKIIEKVLVLIEWNMKYNTPEVKERRMTRWSDL